MNTPWYIAGRIVGNRSRSFSSLIVKLAVASTALSVATMVVTLGLVNGFQQTVANKVYGFWGDARIQRIAPMRSQMAEDDLFETNDSIERTIAAVPNTDHFFAYSTKSVVLKTTDHFEGVIIKGVDRRFQWDQFRRFLVAGDLPQMPDTGYSNQVVISKATASLLEVGPGDKISCYFIRNGEDIRSRPMVVSGIYKTGIEEYDKAFALADLGFLQRLQLIGPSTISGYQLHWKGKRSHHDAAALALSRALPQGIVCRPVSMIYTNIFDWLDIQDQTKHIVVGIMIAVAAINMITCLLILVIERTRMLGILKALGMEDQSVKKVFWYYALYIAGLGIGIGLFVSLLLLLLQQYTGIITMDESTYYVDTLPVKIIWWQVVAVVIGTFLLCALTLRLPLLYVQRTRITDALRFR